MTITVETLFKNISMNLYKDQPRLQEISLQLMLSNYKIDNISPLEISGICSTFIEDNKTTKKDNKDIVLNYKGILVYDLTGHSGEWFIREFISLKDVEKYILSDRGYFNMFTTSIVVVYQNNIK